MDLMTVGCSPIITTFEAATSLFGLGGRTPEYEDLTVFLGGRWGLHGGVDKLSHRMDSSRQGLRLCRSSAKKTHCLVAARSPIVGRVF